MGFKNILLALLAGSAVAAGLFAALQTSSPSEPKAAFIMPAPTALPDFSLLDQFGAVVDADTFRGQWDWLFFGFTHCPDICPTTLQTLTNAKNELIAAGARDIPRIVLVSVDPFRDTPAILARYLAHFDTGNLGVTGNIEQTRKLTQALGIYFEKVGDETENYNVDHSAAVLLIDPDGRFAGLFSTPHVAADFVHDFAIIASTR